MPTGVLYDLLVPNHGSHPWELTLHFTGFPTATLGDYTGEDSLKSTFRNSLKEASFIAKKSAQSVMDMVIPAREDHWRTLGGNGTSGGSGRNFSKYREIMQSIPLISPNSLDAVPIRVYIRPCSSSTGGGGSYLSSYESISHTSRPAAVVAADGQGTSLGAALTLIIKAWLIEHNAWKTDGAVESASEEESRKVTAVAGEKSKDKEETEIEAAWSVVDVALSGGVELNSDLILRDLHRDLHSPDFFLYIVLHMKPLQS